MRRTRTAERRPPAHAAPAGRWRRLAGIPVTLAGVVLVWGGLGFFGYMAAWQHHSSAAQASLVRSERAVIAAARAGRAPRALPGAHAGGSHGGAPAGPCVVPQASTGQVLGLLVVPALGLTAPVEEGTGDDQLAVAVGHAPTSVLPGTSGSSVLLAHDVSYFVHLGQLRPGDAVLFEDACETVRFTVTAQHVVTAGAPVPDSSGPSLVLDTCYPPDALFFTSQRLLVDATESSSAPKGRTVGRGAASPVAPIDYTVPAPPALVARGLTLAQNEAPMGTMTLAGDPGGAWEQSPGPLDLESAALEAYFGALDAAAAGRNDWWTAVAPGVAMPAAMDGAQVVAHESALNVTINSAAGSPTQVVLQTTVRLSGPAPGTYALSVTLPVVAQTVTVGSWQLAAIS